MIPSMIVILYGFYFTACQNQTSYSTDISIGLITSYYHSLLYDLVANETVKDIKANGILSQDFKFSFHQMFGCDDKSSVDSAFTIWFTYNVSVMIGPECTTGMTPVALMASSLDKPMFGYLSVSSDLSNKTKYTTLSRISYTITYLSEAITVLIMYHKWKNVALIRYNGKNNCAVLLGGVLGEFAAKGITITQDLTIDFLSKDSISNALILLKLTARVIILCGGILPSDNLPFLQAASDAGMMTPDYVYITPYYSKLTLVPWEPWLAPNVTGRAKTTLLKLYQNCIVIATYGENTPKFKEFQNRIVSIVTSNPDKYAVTNYTNDSLLLLGPFYDCVWLYALILNESITNNTGTDITGTEMIAASAFYDYVGVTGRIVIDKNGERISNYYVMKLDSTGTFTPYLLLGANESDNTNDYITILSYYAPPNWNTTDNRAPPSTPVCGYRNEFCPTYVISETALAIALPICLIFVAALISVIVYIQKKKSFEHQLLQLTWKVDLKQLQYISKQLIRVPSVYYGIRTITMLCTVYASFQASFISSSTNLRQDEGGDPNFSTASSYGSVNSGGKFEGCGYYKDSMVAIKRWKRTGNVVIHRENLLHLKMVPL